MFKVFFVKDNKMGVKRFPTIAEGKTFIERNKKIFSNYYLTNTKGDVIIKKNQ